MGIAYFVGAPLAFDYDVAQWDYGVVTGYRFVSTDLCYVNLFIRRTNTEVQLRHGRFLATSYLVYALAPEKGTSIMDVTCDELNDLFDEITARSAVKTKGKDPAHLLAASPLPTGPLKN